MPEVQCLTNTFPGSGRLHQNLTLNFLGIAQSEGRKWAWAKNLLVDGLFGPDDSSVHGEHTHTEDRRYDGMSHLGAKKVTFSKSNYCRIERLFLCAIGDGRECAYRFSDPVSESAEERLRQGRHRLALLQQ